MHNSNKLFKAQTLHVTKNSSFSLMGMGYMIETDWLCRHNVYANEMHADKKHLIKGNRDNAK